jgi:hypothetical protein
MSDCANRTGSRIEGGQPARAFLAEAQSPLKGLIVPLRDVPQLAGTLREGRGPAGEPGHASRPGHPDKRRQRVAGSQPQRFERKDKGGEGHDEKPKREAQTRSQSSLTIGLVIE